MLLHEVLARARMREDQRRASQERLARRLVAARRWHRVARYVERRARRAAGRLASSEAAIRELDATDIWIDPNRL